VKQRWVGQIMTRKREIREERIHPLHVWSAPTFLRAVCMCHTATRLFHVGSGGDGRTAGCCCWSSQFNHGRNLLTSDKTATTFSIMPATIRRKFCTLTKRHLPPKSTADTKCGGGVRARARAIQNYVYDMAVGRLIYLVQRAAGQSYCNNISK